MGRNRFTGMWVRFSLSRFGRWLRLDRLPVNVTPNDGFTRFLVHSNQFHIGGLGRVEPSALLPRYNQATARWETSTYRTDLLRRPNHIWIVGYEYVEHLPERRIKARGLGVVNLVARAGLGYEVNHKPYPRHADIINWPNGPKSAQMMAARILAKEMALEIDPRTRA
jgi:hypothetical protein